MSKPGTPFSEWTELEKSIAIDVFSKPPKPEEWRICDRETKINSLAIRIEVHLVLLERAEAAGDAAEIAALSHRLRVFREELEQLQNE